MAVFGYRILGAAFFDGGVYEGIEADRSATLQAMATVLLASAAAGIGAAGWRGPDPIALLVVAGLALVAWLAWAILMFQIGGRLMPGPNTRTSPGELMRTIGFAAAPGLLQVFAVFPRMTAPVFIVAWIWMFAATVTAVRHALDYDSTVRTLVVCGLAAGLSIAMALVLGALFGPSLS
jgi:hypothetical protein